MERFRKKLLENAAPEVCSRVRTIGYPLFDGAGGATEGLIPRCHPLLPLISFSASDRAFQVQLTSLRSFIFWYQDTVKLEELERRLDYDDIRFYRSVARQRARKELAEKRRRDEEIKKRPQAGGGWTGWLWGSRENTSDTEVADDPFTTGEMNDEQRRQLYEVLDYDERAAVAESFSAPRDALKLRVTSKLNKGSFGLRSDPHGEAKDIVSIVFDVFRANFSQRPEGFDTSISLGGFEVHDGTTKNTLYPQIVHVKELTGSSTTVTNEDMLRKGSVDSEDPFFYLKFEKSPVDERADTALTMRMRHMEIVYHRGIVEAVYEFFRPPANQLESVEALLVGAPL